MATSLAWDAAGATANLVAVGLLGVPVLRTLRRFSHRLDPVVELGAVGQRRARGHARTHRSHVTRSWPVGMLRSRP